ncbi:MAG: tetratricopeptide repeat protein [Desulfococcaceae bacterium]
MMKSICIKPCNTLRYGVFLFIVTLSAILLYHLSLQLISEICQHHAAKHMDKGHYGLAVGELEKAAQYPFADSEIYRNLGEAFYLMAGVIRNSDRKWDYLDKSDKAFQKAAERNSLDYRIFFGLAKTQWYLTELYRNRYPDAKEIPYNPLAHFQEAVRLRPNGIQNNFALLRYLSRTGHQDEMYAVIRRLVHNWPPVFAYLKKEDFWSENLLSACRDGLAEAIEKQVLPRQAHMIFSGILAEAKEWPEAILHLQNAMQYKEFENRTADYLRLGHLYFHNGEKQKAEEQYFRGLGMSREKDLETLYGFYKKQEDAQGFYAFLQEARKKFSFSFRTDILTARVLADMKRYPEAKDILRQINIKRPEAQAYYWLAKIAEMEQDWDAMELAIQKATVYDPENRHYHAVFSNVLRKLKKYERAEKEAALSRKK